MTECSPNRQKILWEKEKLLVMSNFYFFRSVFKRLVLQIRKNQGLFGKELVYTFGIRGNQHLDKITFYDSEVHTECAYHGQMDAHLLTEDQ